MRSMDQRMGQLAERATASGSGSNDNVRIRTYKNQDGSSYSFYQSIEIHSGPGGRYQSYQYAPPLAPPGPNWGLLLAAVLAGAWAAGSAALARAYSLTSYREGSTKVLLVLLWPLLALLSRSFREQFVAVVMQQQVRGSSRQQAAAAAPATEESHEQAPGSHSSALQRRPHGHDSL